MAVLPRLGLRYPLGHVTARTTELATFADLQALPDDARAEVIRGALVEKAWPSGEHSGAQCALGGLLARRFQRHPGGRWPGGWWFGTEVEVEYEDHEVYCHDVAGWRRDRIIDRPRGRPMRTRPDWVCELLSPGDTRRDLVDKAQVLYRHRVPHYWIADPLEGWLHVERWDPDGYLVVLAAGATDTVRAEPFEAVELRVAALFGIEDDEE